MQPFRKLAIVLWSLFVFVLECVFAFVFVLFLAVLFCAAACDGSSATLQQNSRVSTPVGESPGPDPVHPVVPESVETELLLITTVQLSQADGIAL